MDCPTEIVPAEKTVESILKQMTLEEKVSMCHAHTKFSSTGVARLDVPELVMSDGPHGVRPEIAKDSWLSAGRDDDHCTYLPVGSALASTWNPGCAQDFGYVLGREARERGKDVILAPGVNIIRTPLCGRNFEYMSEDPHLTASLAVPLIQSVQRHDVAACVKHFAVNNQELNRFKTNAEVDERTLREIYLPAFEAAVRQGKVLSVMGAYNLFRGQHCCHNSYLLQTVLKDEWGFPGLVVSDWAGTHDTDEAVRNGLDIEMGTPVDYQDYFMARSFYEGVRNGTYPVSLLDDKVRRILYVMMETGMLNRPRRCGARNTQEHQQIAKSIAQESIVLLKNEDRILPLNASTTTSVLVVGENANRKMAMGGGSSEVKALYEVTPLEGIRNLLGHEVNVEYIKGYPVRDIPVLPLGAENLAVADQKAGTRGWVAEFHQSKNFDGKPDMLQVDEEINFIWGTDSPVAGLNGELPYCVRWTAKLTASMSGEHRFGACNTNELSLYIDGVEIFNSGHNTVACYTEGAMVLDAGQSYDVTVEYYVRGISAQIEIGWLAPGEKVPSVQETYRQIFTAAERADAVIFVGGLNHMVDTEARDRPDMKLPEGQDGLLAALLEHQPNTVVALISGGPVEMPWVESAKAVLWMSYAGMEGGSALAEVLFGVVNPSGKLPTTFPQALSDSPAHAIGEYRADTCRYTEGVMVGYRYFDTYEISPLFEFGRGLSYTKFSFSGLQIKSDELNGQVVVVSCSLRNEGTRDGAEVVQFYVQDVESCVSRPDKELKGFVKVFLEAGETRTVSVSFSRRDLSFYDVDAAAWRAETGEFKVHVGASSRDIRLSGSFDFTAQENFI